MVRITDVNQKYAGAEPKFSGVLASSEVISTLNWYAQNKVNKDSHKYALTYFKKKHKIDISSVIKSEPSTFGFLCRILTNGGLLPNENKIWFEEKQQQILKKVNTPAIEEDDDTSTATTAVINIQDRIRQKAGECIGELEGQIDDMMINSFSSIPEPYGVMHTLNIKAPHASKINAYFLKQKVKYEEVLNTADKLLKEGYSNFTKSEIKKIMLYCDRVIAAGKKIQELSKKTRKPRKKKVD